MRKSGRPDCMSKTNHRSTDSTAPNALRYEIFIDGSCAFCRWMRGQIEPFDTRGLLRFLDYNDPDVSSRVPLPSSELAREMNVRTPEGFWLRGFKAWLAVLRVLPRLAWIGRIAGAPPLRWLGPSVYGFVARHRHRIPGVPAGCESGACAMPGKNRGKKFMKTFGLLMVLILSTRAFAQTPSEDPYKTGRDYTQMFYDGKADELWARFSPVMKKVFDNAKVVLGIHYQLAGQYGPETELSDEQVLHMGDLTIYQREVMFQKVTTPMMVQWTFDSNGTIEGFYVQAAAAAPSKFLDYKDQVNYRLPFKGDWLVFSGGRSLAENRHSSASDQRFAYDFVATRHGTTFSEDGTRLDQFFSFGQPVLAPAAGTVVEAHDGTPDNPVNSPFASPPTGNYVVLDHGNSEYTLLAHMKQGSIKVKVGDKLKAGQMIGRCGNSGNSSTPHLHIHLQNTAVPFKGAGLPLQFRNYLADKKFVNSGEPTRGQKVHNKQKD
jgi:murein DD-endopeptidase MepM/ murein hydrolase activator NlpD/predicted DCC family thiol-disulfide oxidoreductase YuxK